MEEPRRILVVKLGAFGNVILSFGPFAAIRRHHAGAHITLLTTAPFADWLAQSPWFDAVWIDERPEWWDLPGWLRLRRRLIDGRFDRAYDLQTSGRSSRYFQLLPRRDRPAWSGIAHGCALPDRDPTATGRTTSTASSASFARPASTGANLSICPGATPTSPASPCPSISRCWSPAVRRTGR